MESKKHPLDDISGFLKFTVVGYKSMESNAEQIEEVNTLQKPKVVVNYQGNDMETFSADKLNLKFPFQANVTDKAAFQKHVSIKILDDEVEVGEMKLKMQTLAMAGAIQDPKQVKNFQAILDAMTQPKTIWFPLFADKKPAGSLQIKTQFILDDTFSVQSTVYEGGRRGQEGGNRHFDSRSNRRSNTRRVSDQPGCCGTGCGGSNAAEDFCSGLWLFFTCNGCCQTCSDPCGAGCCSFGGCCGQLSSCLTCGCIGDGSCCGDRNAQADHRSYENRGGNRRYEQDY